MWQRWGGRIGFFDGGTSDQNSLSLWFPAKSPGTPVLHCTGLKRGNNLAKGDYYQSTAVGVADSFAHSLEPNSRDRLSGPEIFLGKVAGV
jgi:hypothetical protein